MDDNELQKIPDKEKTEVKNLNKPKKYVVEYDKSGIPIITEEDINRLVLIGNEEAPVLVQSAMDIIISSKEEPEIYNKDLVDGSITLLKTMQEISRTNLKNIDSLKIDMKAISARSKDILTSFFIQNKATNENNEIIKEKLLNNGLIVFIFDTIQTKVSHILSKNYNFNFGMTSIKKYITNMTKIITHLYGEDAHRNFKANINIIKNISYFPSIVLNRCFIDDDNELSDKFSSVLNDDMLTEINKHKKTILSNKQKMRTHIMNTYFTICEGKRVVVNDKFNRLYNVIYNSIGPILNKIFLFKTLILDKQNEGIKIFKNAKRDKTVPNEAIAIF